MRIPFLLDEHISTGVRLFLAERGHLLYTVKEEAGEATTDDAVVFTARQLRAVVITNNRKHYQDIATRSRDKGASRERTWGLVIYEGEHARALGFLKSVMSLVEFEYREGCEAGDYRMLLNVEQHGRKIILVR
ncbi:MAG: DUF5615 family PIN-like protein [Chloroflexota bacterium]